MCTRKLAGMFDPIKRLMKNESGGISLHLLWVFLCIGIAGIAIDSSHALNMKQRMQVTADAAAHAAATRLPDMVEARLAAVTIAQTTMDPEEFGDALVLDDIEFGVWDTETREFTASTVNPNSARVTVRQQGGASKLIPTFLLHIVGQETFAVQTQATFVNSTGCLGNALITDGTMDFDFNFSVTKGFCLYGVTYKMKEAQKNGQPIKLEIGSGATVQAPDSQTLDALRLKSINTDYVNIEAAFVTATYDVPFYDITNCIIQMYKNPQNAIQPPYITYPSLVTITKDMYVMPREGEDPANPNDGPGPFANTPVYTGGNGVDDWGAVRAQIDACPVNSNLPQTSYTGPYLEEMDLVDVLAGGSVQSNQPNGENSQPNGKKDKKPKKGKKPKKDPKKNPPPPDPLANYVFVDPNDLVPGAVHYFECPASGGYVVFDSGIELAGMVLISECGFGFGGPLELSNDTNDLETVNPVLFRTTQTGPTAVQRPYLHDLVLLAEGTHKNTIFARFGLRAGAPDNCSPGGGVLMISNGSMRVHGYYDMHDVQAIAPNDIHWHQIVHSWGGITIAGTKIHAMRNWMSEYVGCTEGSDQFLYTGAKTRRLVR